MRLWSEFDVVLCVLVCVLASAGKVYPNAMSTLDPAFSGFFGVSACGWEKQKTKTKQKRSQVFFRILQGFLGFFRVLSGSLGFFRVLQGF